LAGKGEILDRVRHARGEHRRASAPYHPAITSGRRSMDGYSNQRLALEAVTSCGSARAAARGRESWMRLGSVSAPLPMRRPAQRRNSPATHCVIVAALLLCLPLAAVAQPSVAPSEERTPERIGADMDGQVDRIYECKDQNCERP